LAPGQISPAPCLVQDISEMGAKLRVNDGWIVPKTFWLRINGDSNLRHCTVAWRKGQVLGVRFAADDKSWWRHTKAALNGLLPIRARS
jgi:hypothetical protein